jgi:hypothetical protein
MSRIAVSLWSLVLVLWTFQAVDGDDLARTPFPLADRPTFDAELAELADVLVAKIEHPAPANFVRDRVLGHELDGVFELIREWPLAKFREPLVQYLKSREFDLIECADALLAFEDDEVQELVDSRPELHKGLKRLRSNRLRVTPNAIMSQMVNRLLKLPPRPAGKFARYAKLLPPRKDDLYDKLDWPEAMTVQAAVSQLNDSDASVRLQSWLWLAERGIIGPTEIVSETWQRLSQEQQTHLCKVQPRFVGRMRLLALFDHVAANSSDSVRSDLFVRRAALGIEGIQEPAYAQSDELRTDHRYRHVSSQKAGRS